MASIQQHHALQIKLNPLCGNGWAQPSIHVYTGMSGSLYLIDRSWSNLYSAGVRGILLSAELIDSILTCTAIDRDLYTALRQSLGVEVALTASLTYD